MQKIIFFFLIGITLLSTSCNDETVTATATEVNIRIKNVSPYDYTDVIVSNTDYGTIASGEETQYEVFETAYSYANVFLRIDGEDFRLQVIDFVGEEPLSSGDYTYEIGANENGDTYTRLTIVTKED